jgi:hypothetical protein
LPGEVPVTLDAKALWEWARSNGARLDACKLHDFSEDLSPAKILGKRWRCRACGGEVDATAKRWYELGRAHVRS